MTTGSTTITGRGLRKGLIVAAGGALTLAVAIGALQQIDTSGGEGRASETAVARTGTVSAASTGVSASWPTVYYIVASQEEAVALEQERVEHNRMLAASDGRDLRAIVLVAGSDAEAERFVEMVNQFNSLRDGEGLPPTPIFDVRTRR